MLRKLALRSPTCLRASVFQRHYADAVKGAVIGICTYLNSFYL
jgi:hypothetical protein